MDVWIDDPDRCELLAQAIEVATRSTDEARIRGLAAVLRREQDDARIDQAIMIVSTLAELDPPHVEVMRILACSNGDETGWTPAAILDAYPALESHLLAPIGDVGAPWG